MGITNNPIVNDLFNNRLIYDNNLLSIINKSIYFESVANKNEIIVDLMKYVRDHHTYLNRINTINKYINTYTGFRINEL